MMFLPLRRYADFNGRSRRKEFWLWTLFNTIVVGALVGVLVTLFVTAAIRTGERGGIQRVNPPSSFSPTPDTFEPPPPPEADFSTNAFEADPVVNTIEDSEALEAVPEEGMNYRAYSSSEFSYEYRMDPAIFFQELGAGGWIAFGLLMLWSLFTFIPTLAVCIRRLHDQDKSGWFYLINFVPFVGPIILFVFYLLEGTRGPNQYGPDPKNPYDPRAFS